MSATSATLKKPHELSSDQLSDNVQKLRDSDRMIREDAAYELASNPSPQAAAELCKLLADPDISVRNLVAEVLVKMGPVASEALINEAESSDHDVRKFVADIMALINDERFVPVLIKYLDDKNENVVGSSAEALGHLKNAKAVKPLMEMIKKHPDSSLQAIESLGKIGSNEALPMLSEILDSDNVVLAYAAVEAVGHIGSSKAISKLLDLLKVGNPELRNVVLTTVLKIAGTGNREDLFNATGGKFIEYLVEAAASDDHDVKRAVISELAFWSGDKIVSALIDALEDSHEEIVDLAQGALRIAGNTGLSEILKGLKTARDETKIHLIEISSFLKSPELLDVILAQAQSDNPDVRMAVAQTLNKYSNSESIQTLLKLADDEVGHVRAAALKSLGLVAGESEVVEISRHLDDEYPDVKEACLGTLVLVGGQTTIDLFEKDLKKSDIERKVMAIRGLGWIGEDQAIEILVESLNHEEAEVRRYAIIGLAKMNYHALEENLTMLLADENPEVRKAVIDAYLTVSGPNAAENIKVLLDDNDMWVRFYAINALASIDDVTSSDKLIEILPEQPAFVQIAIINLIGKSDDLEVKAELKKLTESENEDIANAAREALEAGAE